MASTGDPGTLEGNRLAFLRLLRTGVQAKVRQQEQEQQVEERARSGLVKRGGSDSGGSRTSCSSGTDGSGSDVLGSDGEPEAGAGAEFPSARVRCVPAWQALAWRDAFSTEPFFEASVRGRPLRIKQVLQGELNGFGTGLTVWPAACVLLKHLEHRAASRTDDKWLREPGAFVVELGSGTGAVGVAAAMLLQAPARVVLSDVDKIQFLMRENAARVLTGTDKGEGGARVVVDVEAYEWGGEPSERLLPRLGGNQDEEGEQRAYPDLILVSDCILPRLYPVEPLADALAMLSGAHTRVLISYEHRYYQHFDPKARFWALMAARGFVLRELDEREYHPHYRAGDIEIWEITRLHRDG